MQRSGQTTPELAFPVDALKALRASLEADVGSDAAADALRHAGHAAGDALFPLLAAGGSDEAPGELPEAVFWRRVADLFSARGWGHLQFEAIHPALGSLEATDWVEAGSGQGTLRPSCHFTTGLLANLLGRAAGEDVGVLEVECRSRGDLACRFLFGGRDGLEGVYQALLNGQELEQALAQLA